jgi:ribonuclease H2 subunit A
MGPMVYAVAAVPSSYQDALKDLKFDDSKALKAEKRVEMFKAIQSNGSIAYCTGVISAQQISSSMLSRGRITLNEIAVQTTFQIIRGFLEQDMKISSVRKTSIFDDSHLINSSAV